MVRGASTGQEIVWFHWSWRHRFRRSGSSRAGGVVWVRVCPRIVRVRVHLPL